MDWQRQHGIAPTGSVPLTAMFFDSLQCFLYSKTRFVITTHDSEIALMQSRVFLNL